MLNICGHHVTPSVAVRHKADIINKHIPGFAGKVLGFDRRLYVKKLTDQEREKQEWFVKLALNDLKLNGSDENSQDFKSLNGHGYESNQNSNILNGHGDKNIQNSTGLNEHGYGNSQDLNGFNGHGDENCQESNGLNGHSGDNSQDSKLSNGFNGHCDKNSQDSKVFNVNSGKNSQDYNGFNEHCDENSQDSSGLNRHCDENSQDFNNSLDTKSDIVSNLSPSDVRILIHSEDELSQSRQFERIFPGQHTRHYLGYMSSPSYSDLLLDGWEERYGHCRQEGVDRIRDLCRKELHLNIPDTEKLANIPKKSIIKSGCKYTEPHIFRRN